jgi:Subtilase family/Secretion system C-terminal sorting domain
MKKLIVFVLMLVITTSAIADVTAIVDAESTTNVEKLQELNSQFSDQFQLSQNAEYERLLSITTGPQAVLNADPNIQLMGMDANNRPVYFILHNVEAAATISTDKVRPGAGYGYSLTGFNTPTSMLGVWDGGAVRASHQEFAGGRVAIGDGSTNIRDHATHVAGTMIASGFDPLAKGMSYEGALTSYDWSNDTGEMATAAANDMLTSNHSYGYVAGWYYGDQGQGTGWYWFGNPDISETEDYHFGQYSSTSNAYDEVAYNAPKYLICKSAGNDRNDFGPSSEAPDHWVYVDGAWTLSTVIRGADGGSEGYDCLENSGVSKNVLTVGAIDEIPEGYTSPDDVVMSSFSCWGPTDDGRIKPDIVANGVNLYSSVATTDDSYAIYNGTSMATPNASGSVNLLNKHYQETHDGNTPYSATMKALLIHTADEAGPAEGPDYMNGWGLMNTHEAAKVITADQNNPGIMMDWFMGEGQSLNQSVYLDGSEVTLTMVWKDPAGDVIGGLNDPTPNLKNDLDLRLIYDEDGFEYMPYVLDPANPGNSATWGDNTVDNVEKIYVESLPAGNYTVRVTHKGTLVNEGQEFALITEGTSEPPSVNIPISEIQTVVDPALDDASPLVGQYVQIEGIITFEHKQLDYRSFYMADAAGPWNGIKVVLNDGQEDTYFPAMGYGWTVVAYGMVNEINGVTVLEVSENQNVGVLNSLLDMANLPAAIAYPVVSFDQLETADLAGEQYESVLVQVANVSCSQIGSMASVWPLENESFELSDGSGNNLSVQEALHFKGYIQHKSVGKEYLSIKGIVTFDQDIYQDYALKYQILPAISYDLKAVTDAGNGLYTPIPYIQQVRPSDVWRHTNPENPDETYRNDQSYASGNRYNWEVPSEFVTVHGIVTMEPGVGNHATGADKFIISDFESGTFSDNTQMPWGSLLVYVEDASILPEINLGDEVTVFGPVNEYGWAMTQLLLDQEFCDENPNAIQVISSGNPVPNSLHVEMPDIRNGDAIESFESMFVSIGPGIVHETDFLGVNTPFYFDNLEDNVAGIVVNADAYSMRNGAYIAPVLGTTVYDVTGWINNLPNSSNPEDIYYHFRINPASADGIDSDPSGNVQTVTDLNSELNELDGDVNLMWTSAGSGDIQNLVYDDGVFESAWFWGESATPNNEMGNRFTPAGSGRILEVSAFFKSSESAVLNDVRFVVHAGSESVHHNGELLFYSNDVTPLDEEWTILDLSSEGIMVEGDFWVDIQFPTPGGPMLCVDRSYPQYRRSFFAYVSDLGDRRSFGNDDLMIRAKIQLEDYSVETVEFSAGSGFGNTTLTEYNPEVDVDLINVEGGSDGLSLDALRDFTEYIVYRDGDEIGRTAGTMYYDILESYGTYEYTVSAVYMQGESEQSEGEIVDWETSNIYYDPVPSTGLPYTIAILDFTYDGETIDGGYEIGVFDGDLCVGAVLVQSLPASLTAWQEDIDMGLAGFTPGNDMRFVVYEPMEDAEFELDVEYVLGDGTFGFGIGSQVNMAVIDNQELELLIAGGRFEMISTPVVPDPLAVDVIFGDLTTLQIVKQVDGGVYWPATSTNTIGDIDVTQGYRVFLSEDETLSLVGETIDIETEYSLTGGQWNWVGYPFLEAVDVSDALAVIEEDLIIILNDDGNVLWPSAGINTLGYLEPGVGYMVYVNEDVTFTFSDGMQGLTIASNPRDYITNLQVLPDAPKSTGLPYIVKVSLSESLMNAGGSIVELYDGRTLVGKGAVVEGKDFAVVTAWQGIPSLNLSGFTPGSEIEARVLNGANIEISSYNTGSAQYGTNALASISLSSEDIPVEFEVGAGYPNPFNPSITVPLSLPNAGEVKFSVYNILGQVVFENSQQYVAGHHKYRFMAGSQMVSGVYFMKVEFGKNVSFNKIMLLK